MMQFIKDPLASLDLKHILKTDTIIILIKFSLFWGLYLQIAARGSFSNKLRPAENFFLINFGPRRIFSLECVPSIN
jgi:hypothetical protein